MQFAICWNPHFKSGGLQTGLGARVHMRQLVPQQSGQTAGGRAAGGSQAEIRAQTGETTEKKWSGSGDSRTSVSERVWGWEVGR